jgi:hypothetical protein
MAEKIPTRVQKSLTLPTGSSIQRGSARRDVADIRVAFDSFVKSGFVLEHSLTPPGSEPWRAFLTVRAGSREEVQARLSSLASSERLQFDMHEIEFDTRQLEETRASAQVR